MRRRCERRADGRLQTKKQPLTNKTSIFTLFSLPPIPSPPLLFQLFLSCWIWRSCRSLAGPAHTNGHICQRISWHAYVSACQLNWCRSKHSQVCSFSCWPQPSFAPPCCGLHHSWREADHTCDAYERPGDYTWFHQHNEARPFMRSCTASPCPGDANPLLSTLLIVVETYVT